MSLLADAKELLGVSDLFTLYKGVNQIEIDKSFQKSTNYINELNAQAALGRLQNLAVMDSQAQEASNTDIKKYLGWGLLAVAGVAALYLVVKK